MDKWQTWFEIFASERSMMFFVLLFIMIVAAFSIMNTMITVAVQKRREIGMMRSLGAKASQIIFIFLYKGIIVGLIGTVLGLVAGLGVLYFRNGIPNIFNKNINFISLFLFYIGHYHLYYCFHGGGSIHIKKLNPYLSELQLRIDDLALKFPSWSANERVIQNTGNLIEWIQRETNSNSREAEIIKTALIEVFPELKKR